ncbi:zinc finger BED domain-containing protein DAYSLEEPER-like [Trifolium pratense]|uniref:zinc finger BED domain-containing protein DAYSLEEPER-like n=1 Tax=Trifolium pratense TaxID=57577 RepID=UPI001E691283|nr:zinc finger BED domain-containing protein DAYSLEEPER-like [Trifolium pratense]
MDDFDTTFQAIDEDDLVMLESPLVANTKNVIEGDSVEIKNKKKRARRSPVWKHFTRIGKVDGGEKCTCNSCHVMYTCGGGTGHLKRHILACHKVPDNHDEGLKLDDEETLLKKWQFDNKAYRDSLARSIIRHDLPFSYVEYDAVLVTNKILNPDFVLICRNTAKTDCMSVFSSEKERLKSVLASIPGRVCLTSDVWTAVTTQVHIQGLNYLENCLVLLRIGE